MRTIGNTTDISQFKRVLVIRSDKVGDVVLTVPMLRELRKNLPNANITLVVKPEVYNIVELCPYVNEVLKFDSHIKGKLIKVRMFFRLLVFALKHLWTKSYDLALVPRWGKDYYFSAWIALLSRAKERIGYYQSVSHMDRYQGLYTYILNEKRHLHWVEYCLNMLRQIGFNVEDTSLELWLDDDYELFTSKLFEVNNIDLNDFIVAVSISPANTRRMWPTSSFIELSSWLINICNMKVILIGAEMEEIIGKEMECELSGKVINLIGKTSLRETAAILKRCNLFIGGDSGPMHIAAAAKTPVIEISCHPKNGSESHFNSPVHFAPWGISNIILRPDLALSPCVDGCESNKPHCISQVDVEDVKSAVLKMKREQSIELNNNIKPYGIKQ